MTHRRIHLGLLAALLAGCAAEPVIPPPLQLPARVVDQLSPATRGDAAATSISETPKPPTAAVKATKPEAPQTAFDSQNAEITLAFDGVPLPTFIQSVYGVALKRNVNLDPKVAERQDLVTLRSGTAQTAAQVHETMRLLLRSYGLSVIEAGNLIRIVPDGANVGALPEIRRGRALPDTPLPLRPVFHLVELRAVRNTDVTGWVRQIMGTRVTMQEDPGRNALLLSGNRSEIEATLELIDTLDQPLMNGRQSIRIEPVYWAVDELSKKLSEVLRAEGYKVGVGVTDAFSTPITLITIPAINALICFGGDNATLQHVAEWVRELDQPAKKATGRRFMSYQVQNIDATKLAATLEQILGKSTVGADGKPVAGANTASVVVDTNSNSLIFKTSNEDYGQILTLLQTIDRPARAALIEVTVAEVALKDNAQLGVEWLATEAKVDGTAIKYGTLGGLSIGTSGFNFAQVNGPGDRRLLLNALASSNRATILSSPRVMARSGESATIQVGQEVPVLTSQQTSPTTGGNGSLIQTVQYRNTGVILTVKPVIHSGGQIDIDLSQEVSAAQSTNTGVNTSPTFGQRRIQTKLALKHGSTVLLGGLISDNTSKGNAGIPLLKDIPLFGQAFRTNTNQNDRTELIMLITPYILNDDGEASAITEEFRKQLGPWARSIKPEEAPRKFESAVPPAPTSSPIAPAPQGVAPISRPGPSQ